LPGAAFAGAAWRQLFGWFALPVATLLVVLGLSSRTGAIGGRGPMWRRVVGAELAMVSALALTAVAFDPPDGHLTNASSGPAGIVGRSVADAVVTGFGRVGGATALVVLGVGGAALLAMPHHPATTGGGQPDSSLLERRRRWRRRRPGATPTSLRNGRGQQIPLAAAGPSRMDVPVGTASDRASVEAGNVRPHGASARIPGSSVRSRRLPPPDIWDADAVGDVVRLGEVLADPAFRRVSRRHRMALPLGRAPTGEVVVADLAAMPHLLVAGGAQTGKSALVSALICALACQNTPDELRLVLVDPTGAAAARLGRLPHLVGPVAGQAAEIVGAVRWLAAESDARHRRLGTGRSSDWRAWNKISRGKDAAWPALVAVVDEGAESVASGDQLEPLLARVAQLGAVAGVHLILATRRRASAWLGQAARANLPARIALRTDSQEDSLAVVGCSGAEVLPGPGQLLFLAPGAPGPRRVQAVWVSDLEIDRLTAFWAGHWITGAAPVAWSGALEDSAT
jgi:hypothetical protein